MFYSGDKNGGNEAIRQISICKQKLFGQHTLFLYCCGDWFKDASGSKLVCFIKEKANGLMRALWRRERC